MRRPRTRVRSFALAAMLALAACSDPSEPFDHIIPDGLLHGLAYSKTEVYRGVPYALPPTGDLRFRPPIQNDPYPQGLSAVDNSLYCPKLLIGAGPDPYSSEDCLYLNVWVPRDAGPHPVMVFFPGGAYVIDGAPTGAYDGRKLSEAGRAIVVVANYRLGALGWAYHTALASEDSTHPTSGNYGILDQREVLRWVQRNIGALDGDPNNVTIFGESAGAGSVCVHLLSPGSEGLFNAAIMESPPCTAYPFPTQTQAAQQGADLATALGCSGDDASILSCLRNVTANQILQALPLKTHIIYGPGVAWGPVVDGYELPDAPNTMLSQGLGADVPIIVGSNADEGSLFFEEDQGINTTADMSELLSELFPSTVVDAIIAHYPIMTNAQDTAVHIVGDMFVCDARRVARYWAAAGRDAYRYYFARTFYDIILDLGSFHGAELPFVFGNALQGLPVLPMGRPLKNAIQSYWTTLARYGNPNNAGRPSWPAYDPTSDLSMYLDLPVHTETGIRASDCDFWDAQRGSGP